MKKIISILILMLCLSNALVETSFAIDPYGGLSREEWLLQYEQWRTSRENGMLYIDNILVEGTDTGTVIFRGMNVAIPLRTLFESLGATVTWDADTGNTFINYKDITYKCRTGDEAPYVPHTFHFYVKNTYTKESIKLNPMTNIGLCEIINDRTYISSDTAKYFLQAIRYSYEVDTENKTVRITTWR